LHDPTARLKELRDDRVHARTALVRDLFGLTVEEGDLSGELPEHDDLAEDGELAQVRELRRR
jgi:hypothetical protein